MEQPFGYSISKTAQLLGVCRNTVYRASERGELDIVKIANRSIVTAASLQRRLGSAVFGEAA